MLNVLDLFSGIGGFTYGLEMAGGFNTIAFCEINEFCRKVLKKHWPSIPIFKDVKEINGEKISETIDIVTGGWPCQPVSVAGKRKGSKDDRWLWPEMFRVIKEFKPTWVIGENVTGIISMELNKVLFDLEGEGYETATFIIPACAVGAPHRRDRAWVLAHTNNTGFSNFIGELPTKKRAGVRKTFSVAHCRKMLETWNRNTFNKIESTICRISNGVPDGMDRLRALGNSIVPQIVTIIGTYIREINNVETNSKSLRRSP